MRLRYLLGDNVRCLLSGTHNSSVTTISIVAPTAPLSVPPNPAGAAGDLYANLGAATIVNDLNTPTKMEIITFTTATDVGGGIWQLTGVTRGAHGTMAQTWAATDTLYQSIFVAGTQIPGIVADGDLQELQLTGWPLITDKRVQSEIGIVTTQPSSVNATGSVSVDWSTGYNKVYALTGNTTFSFTGAPVGATLSLELNNHASSDFTVTWPATVEWVGRVIPNHRTGNSHRHLFMFRVRAASSYIGSALINCGQP